MSRALGIDVSVWNGKVDFGKAKAAGAEFVFCKSSQVVEDATFRTNWKNARDAGLLRGAYHYLDFRISELGQAKLFINLLSDDPGELPPVVDFEQRLTVMPAAAIVRGKLWNFLQYVERETGKIPEIYSGFYYWREFSTPDPGWLKYSFWLAWYAPEWFVKLRSGGTGAPRPWLDWKFWQFKVGGNGGDFGSTGKNIDMDYFNGTIDDLRKFAVGAEFAPTPIPPTALGPYRVLAQTLKTFTGPGDAYKQAASLAHDQVVNVIAILPYRGEPWAQIGLARWCRLTWLVKK